MHINDVLNDVLVSATNQVGHPPHWTLRSYANDYEYHIAEAAAHVLDALKLIEMRKPDAGTR